MDKREWLGLLIRSVEGKNGKTGDKRHVDNLQEWTKYEDLVSHAIPYQRASPTRKSTK